MSACPCHCGRTVRDGCTYATRTCWNRCRRQAAAGTRPICQTCPDTLIAHDVAVGCKRCRTCRGKTPGRAKASYPGYQRRTTAGSGLNHQGGGVHKAGRGITISYGPLKAAKQKELTSWWMEPAFSERAAFQAEARRRNPGGDRARDIMPTRGARGFRA